jgi:hypothetical protein
MREMAAMPGRFKRFVTVPKILVVMVVLGIIAGTVVAVNPPARSHGLAVQAPGSQHGVGKVVCDAGLIAVGS